MYNFLLYDGIIGEGLRGLLQKGLLQYCPFCGAKITETQLHESA